MGRYEYYTIPELQIELIKCIADLNSATDNITLKARINEMRELLDAAEERID